MTVTTPALSGSESIVGLVREATWGTTPTSGSDPDKVVDGITFFPIKEESVQAGFNAESQMDDMGADREITRVIEHGSMNEGSLRMIPGPESIGHFLTMIFGTPTSSQLESSSGGDTDTDVWQHTWSPGLNARTAWPVPYSIESIFAATRSKLIRGAICRRLPIDLPNNGPAMITPEFVAKNIIWLGTDAGSKGSGTTNDLSEERPAVMTASPVVADETPWHFKQLTASPQIDDVNVEVLTAINFEFAFPGLEGLFTGGSGLDLGTYRVDLFQLSGRATILFDDESYWETFKAGDYFKLESVLEGDTIQGAHKNQLSITAYSCKANTNENTNRVGNLEYDFGWTARKCPTEGKSCEIVLINSVASYA